MTASTKPSAIPSMLNLNARAISPGIGLVGAADKPSKEAMLNAQMKQALEKVAFLPFGKLIDEWRWGVFDGSIKPDHYNTRPGGR